MYYFSRTRVDIALHFYHLYLSYDSKSVLQNYYNISRQRVFISLFLIAVSRNPKSHVLSGTHIIRSILRACMTGEMTSHSERISAIWHPEEDNAPRDRVARGGQGGLTSVDL